MSTRAVEEQLRREGTPVGKSTISDLAQTARKAGPSRPAASSPPRKGRAQPPEAPPEDETAGLVASTEELIAGASARDVGQLERTGELFTKRIEQALAEGDVKVLATLTPLRLQITQTLARVRPPPKADPESDPANVAARAELRARVERLAAETESADATRAAIRAHLDRLDAAGAAPSTAKVT